MLYLALSKAQNDALEQIDLCGFCPAWFCSSTEWNELVIGGYCWQDESGEYKAHEVYSTPGFIQCEPDAKGTTGEAGDRAFEDRREYIFISGGLQI